MAAEKALEEQCRKKGIKRATDVEELYLGKSNIEEAPNFAKFKNLKRLWLNKNQLYRLQGLECNYHLTELYLENNMLTEINGSIQQLTCLQILLLHGNQLQFLTDVIHELRYMQSLKTLNLFGNPLAQEYGYRTYTIFSIPSLQLLDRKAISGEERQNSSKKYDAERQRMKDSVAFWRRADDESTANQARYSTSTSCLRTNMTQIYIPKHVKYEEELATDTSSNEQKQNGDSTANTNDQKSKRAIMQLNRFGWIDILEARTKSKDATPEPCIYTTKFR
ncbi:leucine-rich repeat-containing protein 72-like [Rhopilema esculentum]|uniref:leucine-rich repeat-containing protein 72-like n=1 Tax=Rhopilema esculentum TaxID=499914 RepID=UPI0031DA31D3